MTEPSPITWALDLLQAHGIPPLAEAAMLGLAMALDVQGRR